MAALYCGRALAGDPTSPSGTASVEPASDTPAAGDVPGNAASRASKLEDEAFQEFDKGNYRGAAELLQQLYELTHDPTFLFNLGVAYHWLGECEMARGYYEQYLERAPGAENAEQAKESLQPLYATCGHTPPKTKPPPPPPPPTPRLSEERPQWQTIAAPTLLGVGAATTFGLILTLALSKEAYDDRTARVYKVHAYDPEAVALTENGDRYRKLGIGFGVASGVLLGAGLGLLFVDLGSRSSVGVTGNGQAGITYRSQF